MDSKSLQAMVGGCPWGDPVHTWTEPQLRRGIEQCEVRGGETPRLGQALARELKRRKARADD